MADLGDFSDLDGDDPNSSPGVGDGEQTGSVAGNGRSARTDPVSETKGTAVVSSADSNGADVDHDDRGGRDDSLTDVIGGADVTDDGDGLQFDSYDTNPVGDERGLGVTVVSQGLRVSEDSDRTALRALVTAGSRERVRLGKHLVIPYPGDKLLFRRIIGLEYAQEFQADDVTEIRVRRVICRPADKLEECDFKSMTKLGPIAVLFSDDGDLKRRMVDRAPEPQVMVRRTTNATWIKVGPKIPEAGVFLGHLSVSGEKVRTTARPSTIDCRLSDDYIDGDPLAFRHTLIAGGTSSRKTRASKSVLRQYLSEERNCKMNDGREIQIAVVQFDPQDEYTRMHGDNPDMGDETAWRYECESITHGGHDDTVAFTPKMAGLLYPGVNYRAEQLEFAIPFSMVWDLLWLVAGSSLNGSQYPAFIKLSNRFFQDYSDAGTHRRSLQYLDDPVLKEELHESGQVREATFGAVKRRVRGVPSDVFDQDARPITELDHQLVRPGGLTVVPTHHLSPNQVKELSILVVLALLIDDKLPNDPSSNYIKETPLVLGVNEAHNFLADANSVQVQKIIQKFTEAARQGRKGRLGLLLITQNPQDIADPVLKQANTKVVLNLGDGNAVKSVNIPPSLEDKVPYTEKSQMVVYSSDSSDPVELTGLSTCVTRHGD